MAERVGVIGLGNMGGGIARNLHKAGLPLEVWDLSAEARLPFADLAGVTIAPPGEMATRCTLMIFVVPATPQIEAAFDGPEGVLAQAAPGLVVYDFTTSDPQDTRAMAARAAERGILYLDAGMSGGAAGAQAGTISLMVGGDRGAFDRTRPVLEKVARNLFYLGGSGAGHTMKLIHNMVLHTMFLATCEGGRMAEAAGIDLKDMIDVFNVSNARSFVSEVRFPRHIIPKTWDGRSRVYNLRKDVAMAVDLADQLAAKVPLGTLTRDFLNAAIARGMTDTDFTRLYERFDEIMAAFEAAREAG